MIRMFMESKIQHAQADTDQIIADLLSDGSDPDAIYLIEHHLSSDDFTLLEKVATEAFQLGYEVTEPERCMDEQNKAFACFDILSEIPLDSALINEQIAQIIILSQKFSIHYDGWGTYFEDATTQDHMQ